MTPEEQQRASYLFKVDHVILKKKELRGYAAYRQGEWGKIKWTFRTSIWFGLTLASMILVGAILVSLGIAKG